MNHKVFFAFAIAAAIASSGALGAWQSAASDIAPMVNVAYTSGDWWITGSELLDGNVTVHTGNVFVNATGKLELRNATLKMNCTASDGQFRIEVRPGGSMYVNDTDANPATATDASILTNSDSAAFGFAFQVNASATFGMSNSILRNCGILVATAGASTSGATLRSDNVSIVGSEIYGCANGLVVDSCNVTVAGSTMRNNKYNGVLVANMSDAAGSIVLNISDSSVRSNLQNGIAVSASTFSGTFSNGNMSSNGGAGARVVAWSDADLTFSSCTVKSNAKGGIGVWGQPGAADLRVNISDSNVSHNAGAPPVWLGFDPAHLGFFESPSDSVRLEFAGNDLWSTNSDYGYIHVAASGDIVANVTDNGFHDPSITTGAYFGKLTEDFIHETVPSCANLRLNFSGNDVAKADGLALLACSTETLKASVEENTITSVATTTTCVAGAISLGYIKSGTDHSTPKYADIVVRGNTIDNVLTGGAIGAKAIQGLNATVEDNVITEAAGFGIKLGWIDDGEYYDDPAPWSLPTRDVRAVVDNNTVVGRLGPGIWIYSSNASVVSSNQVYSKTGTWSGSPGDGIRMQSTREGGSVFNNTVASCSQSGIRLYNATGVSVHNNSLTNNLYGLGLDGGSRGNWLDDNTVSKTASQYGYYLATNSLRNKVDSDNNVMGSHLKLVAGLVGVPGALLPVAGLSEQVPLMSNLGQIVVGDSRYLDVSGIAASNGTAGLCLVNVTDSVVRANAIGPNTAGAGFGIDLRLGSSRNILKGNSLASNARGVGLNLGSGNNAFWSNSLTKSATQWGLYFDGTSKLIANQIPANNTVGGCPVQYVHSQAGASISDAVVAVPLMSNLGQIFAYNATGLVLENVTVAGTSANDGIRLEFSDGAAVRNASVAGGLNGLYVADTDGFLAEDSGFTGATQNVNLVRVANASLEGVNASSGASLARLESSRAAWANGSIQGATGIPIELIGTSMLSLLNTTFQRSGGSIGNGSWINVSWFLDVQAVCNGQDFGVCGVDVLNFSWTPVFAGNTDPSGRLTGLELREFDQEGQLNITHYNPYWVNVTRPGYGPVSVLLAMDAPTRLVANLSDLSPPATTIGPTVSPSTAPTSADGSWLSFTADDSASGNGTISWAEYAISPLAPTANGTGTAMLPADGLLDSSNESFAAFVATAGWDAGTYTIWSHASDAAGNWGPWLAAHLTITDDLGPRVSAGPLAAPNEISSETAAMWLNLTLNDSGMGGSTVVGCGLSVADEAGDLASALYAYDVEAADGAFDEPNESVSLEVDVSLWSLGRHTLTLWGVDSLGNHGTPVSRNITVIDRTPPSSPTGLSLSNQSGNGTLLLVWSGASDADLAGYTVYRSYLSGRSYTALGNVSWNTTTWLDSGLTHGVKYYYAVAAFDNASEPNVSPFSVEVWGTPTAPADGDGDGNETDDPDDDNAASSSLPYIVTVAAIIAAIFAVVIVYRRKKRTM